MLRRRRVLQRRRGAGLAVPRHLPRDLGRVSAGELRHEVCHGISAEISARELPISLRLHRAIERELLQARLLRHHLRRPHWRARDEVQVIRRKAARRGFYEGALRRRRRRMPHWRGSRRTADAAAAAAADTAAAVILVAFVVRVRVLAIAAEAGLRVLRRRGEEAPRRLDASEGDVADDGGLRRTRTEDPALRRLLATHLVGVRVRVRVRLGLELELGLGLGLGLELGLGLGLGLG